MKRIAFPLVLSFLLVALSGCGGGGGGGSGNDQPARAPSISSFSPLSGAPGAAVTINGSSFGSTPGTNTVRFNDTAASVSSASSTRLVAFVPPSATSGPISVTTSAGTAYSSGSFSVLAPAAQVPAAPAGVNASAGNTQITVSWAGVSGADSYNLYWSLSGGVTPATGTLIGNVTSPYVHSGLANSVAVYYVVTAVNSAGESLASAQVSATPAPTIPAAPDGVAAVAADAQNSISWNASFGASTYNLYWSTSPGVTKATGTKIASVSSPYAHAPLANGTTYYYVVTAQNAAGESADSAAVSATPVAPVIPPAAPAGVAAVAGNAQITVSWSPVSGATSYNLYWSTTIGVTKANGTKIAGAASPHVHTALANGTVYYYVVTAVNANGESSDSAQASAIPAATTNSWAASTPLPVGRTSAASGVIAGILYVAGGVPPGGPSTTDVQAYDPVANTWTTKAPAPTSRAGAGAAVINGKLYVIGGCVGSDCRIGTTNALEVYDPAGNSWSSLAPMPTARFQPAVGVIDGVIYVAGGGIACPPCGSLTTLESYNPATNSWATLAPLPSVQAQAGGGVVNGLLYSIGGYSWASSSYLGTVYAYDPVANSWTTKASLPTARNGMGVEVINGILYTVGGSNASGILPTVQAYDAGTNSWSTKAPMPTTRYNVSTGILNGRLYAVGGSDATGLSLSVMEVYTP